MLDFNSEIILENERVLLRPLQAADYEHLVPFSIQEPEIWTYSHVPASSPEKMQMYIDAALQARENKTEYAFIVFDKKANAYAGCTRFYDIQLANGSAQLGYSWYGKNFQGTGLNKNCKYLMLAFAFEKLALARVEFRADNNNKQSIAAMQSIGCTIEGVLRQNVTKPSGGRRDSIILSILKDEWDLIIKKELFAKLGVAIV
jgi:N-acetyltransferase